MTHLPDGVVRHLRDVIVVPDTSGTRYEIREPIARGGMGLVYRAHDRELDRDVALKVLDVGDTGDEMRERMLVEARVLARLEHPGIVPVHDAGVLADGRAFYVMKLVRGARLDEHARAHPERASLLRLFARICDAVAFAHAQGIIHRDLKPGNVMVGDFGEVLVMDWGVARWLGRGDGSAALNTPDASRPSRAVTAAGAVMGTPGYMAPEQARGDSAQVDQRSDIFALGVMLGELAALSGPVPARLRAIVECATAHEPALRYPDVGSLADDIACFVDGEAVRAYREPWYERTWRLMVRHRVAITLVGAYLLMRILIFLVNRF